jgi:hypothetical protein
MYTALKANLTLKRLNTMIYSLTYQRKPEYENEKQPNWQQQIPNSKTNTQSFKPNPIQNLIDSKSKISDEVIQSRESNRNQNQNRIGKRN